MTDASTKFVHERILASASSGEPADFHRPDDPSIIPSFEDVTFWAHRTIEGDWLADLLTDPDTVIHRSGITICGLRICGGLDLQHARLDFPLTITRCQLGPAMINLTGVTARTISLSGTQCGGANLDLAHIAGDVLLEDQFSATGAVRLLCATIGGQPVCRRATFTNPTGDALAADEAHIAGSVLLDGCFAANGTVRFTGVTIGGNLECNGAIIAKPDGDALSASGARIAGSVFLADGFAATGSVRLVRATIGGNLECNGATLTRPGGEAFHGDGAQIAGQVLLGAAFVAAGEVRFSGATIGGSLYCDGGAFTNHGGGALSLDSARITGSVFLRAGFAATGTVRLLGSTIGGNLECDGATLTSSGGDALWANNARVGGGVFLRHGFKAIGAVRLLGATLESSLECDGGTFTNPGAVALAASNVRVTGPVFLRNGFTASGEVRLMGATIGGNLECDGGTFTNPGGDALSANNARITGTVFLRAGFVATGRVRLAGATISNNLSCAGGAFVNPDGDALLAYNARVAGSVILGDGFAATGTVRLVQATAGSLVDVRPAWPTRMILDGFQYKALESPDRGGRVRREWLRGQVDYRPDVYAQLAAVYRASGEDRSARKILIERHNVLLDPPAHWPPPATGRPVWLRRRSRWAWRQFLRLTIGHGYEPWRILGLVVPLVAVLSFWFADARTHDVLEPKGKGAVALTPLASACTSGYRCVQPVVLALDTVIPLVELGQRSAWEPDQSHHSATWYRDGRWLAAGVWVATVLGWVFAALVAASVTQLTKKE